MSYTAVYIIADTSARAYKIGLSSNPEKRNRTLQRDKYSIVLYAYVYLLTRDDAFAYEKKLHNTYKHKRLDGEWFDLADDELSGLIEEFKDMEESRRVIDNKDGLFLSHINLNNLRVYCTANETKEVIGDLMRKVEVMETNATTFHTKVREYIKQADEKEAEIQKKNDEIQDSLNKQVVDLTSKILDMDGEIMSLKWDNIQIKLDLDIRVLKSKALEKEHNNLLNKYGILEAKYNSMVLDKTKSKMKRKRERTLFGFTIK
jgi:hypothetical protein